MEVHAHTHSARRKWTHYFWEFFMLFLAVTLGFIFENQREHYIERQRARQLAIALVEDLATDSSGIISILQAREDKTARLDMLMDELEKRAEQQNDSLMFEMLANEVSNRRFFTPKNGTYQQIKNSGFLRYFTTDIGKELVSYEAKLNVLENSLAMEDKYMFENLLKLRVDMCDPLLLRRAVAKKAFVSNLPMVSKDIPLQQQLYKALIFAQERNGIYIRHLKRARDDVKQTIALLVYYYHLK